LRFALAKSSPTTAGTLTSDGDGDAVGVGLGLAAGMVAVVEAGSSGTRKKIPKSRTVPTVTRVFTNVDVP
jgi:hypothetical protein